MRFSIYASPVGPLILAADDDDALAVVSFRGEPADDWTPDASALRFVTDQLDAWFAGRIRSFDLPLAPRGTEFQQSVWRALREIPYGETTTYGELARTLGRPAASRAVGAANGANSIPIIIPCHRVIGSNRSLTGFGGGLPVKRWLLDHEAKVSGRILPF